MNIKRPNRSQMILTLFGFLLLLAAIILNHYYPHNEGVADVTHSSVYRLSLDLLQKKSTEAPVTNLLNGILGNQSEAKTHPQPVANENTTRPTNLPPNNSGGAAAEIPNGDVDCIAIDSLQQKVAQKFYKHSYQTYLKSKHLSLNTVGPKAKDDLQQGLNSYYETYQNALASAYSAYQLFMAKQGCQPQSAPPIPQTR